MIGIRAMNNDDDIEAQKNTPKRSSLGYHVKQLMNHRDQQRFYTSIKQGNAALFAKFLSRESVNPALDDNYAICAAVENGRFNFVKELLADPRVDPADNDNWAVQAAAIRNQMAILRLLLADARVDPSASDNRALRLSTRYYGSDSNVVLMLLADERIQNSLTPELLTELKLEFFDVVRIIAKDKCTEREQATDSNVCQRYQYYLYLLKEDLEEIWRESDFSAVRSKIHEQFSAVENHTLEYLRFDSIDFN